MPPKVLKHAALDQLASTPDILRMLMANVPDEVAVQKPAPDRWSIAEVLEHLSHVEGHLFRSRVDVILAAEGAPVEAYDEQVFYTAGAYSTNDPEEAFAHWEEQREEALLVLRALEPADLNRAGQHPEFGRFTLGQLLNTWVTHDLGHVRQVAELVRAQIFWPESGPFQPHHHLRP